MEADLIRSTYQVKINKNIFITKMEELLKQIAINTEPKRSFSIVVIDITTIIKTWFKPPIEQS